MGNLTNLGFTLAEDTPDWDLVYFDKYNICELYMSKTSYIFDTESLKGMKLGKIVIHVPFSFEEVWACFWNIQLHKIIDPMGGAESFKLIKYISPSLPQKPSKNLITEDNPPFALQLVDCCTEFTLPFMKKRDLPITMTTIRDPSIDMIMAAGHTCEMPREKQDDHIDAQLMFYYMFYRVNDRETRFVHTVYTDLKLPLNANYMLKLILKKRAK